MIVRSGFLQSGHPSIDLTWTVRYRNVKPIETLKKESDLHAWVIEQGMPVSRRPNSDDLEQFKQLREAIFGALSRAIAGEPLTPTQIRIINANASFGPYQPFLNSSGTIRFKHDGTGYESARSVIARDAMELLALQDDRLRVCARPDCALLFYDSSRPGSRKWCAAERCGNIVNTKAYRSRNK